jgi:hypothetical protein
MSTPPKPHSGDFTQSQPKPRTDTNLYKQHKARKKMDLCEEITGLTSEELTQKQRQFRADYYRRAGREVPK